MSQRGRSVSPAVVAPGSAATAYSPRGRSNSPFSPASLTAPSLYASALEGSAGCASPRRTSALAREPPTNADSASATPTGTGSSSSNGSGQVTETEAEESYQDEDKCRQARLQPGHQRALDRANDDQAGDGKFFSLYQILLFWLRHDSLEGMRTESLTLLRTRLN